MVLEHQNGIPVYCTNALNRDNVARLTQYPAFFLLGCLFCLLGVRCSINNLVGHWVGRGGPMISRFLSGVYPISLNAFQQLTTKAFRPPKTSKRKLFCPTGLTRCWRYRRRTYIKSKRWGMIWPSAVALSRPLIGVIHPVRFAHPIEQFRRLLRWIGQWRDLQISIRGWNPCTKEATISAFADAFSNPARTADGHHDGVLPRRAAAAISARAWSGQVCTNGKVKFYSLDRNFGYCYEDNSSASLYK